MCSYRYSRLLGFFIFLLASLNVWADTPLYFVFDIDDTLARWVRPAESSLGNVTSSINDHRYRILDGAGEAIQALLTRAPNAKIVFYSGGPRDRNLELLSQLILPDGRRAIDIATKVLSRNDIVDEKSLPTGLAAWNELDRTPPSELHYDLRRHGRKDLLKAAPDLQNIVMIEDRLGYAYPGQEKNLLWVGTPPPSHPESFSETRLSRKAYIQYRNKLTRMVGLVDKALEVSKQEQIPLPDVLWKLQWHPAESGKLTYNTALLTDASIYRRGARLLAKTGSARYQFVTPQSEQNPKCLIPILRLLRQ
ncbi:MAG: hypothetical protein A2Z97_04725 [Bdellovibrionales bacterium GWB1_52_6]|nr:MAG: hypothetical protein A2Z97_04725 [Bdellovibrionales bacterium GWB1_52_6]OFZ05558.1 MAG: hypothetical protein A2X97_11865 [Bdellovibrionales bacterium GWA1_52_35]